MYFNILFLWRLAPAAFSLGVAGGGAAVGLGLYCDLNVRDWCRHFKLTICIASDDKHKHHCLFLYIFRCNWWRYSGRWYKKFPGELYSVYCSAAGPMGKLWEKNWNMLTKWMPRYIITPNKQWCLCWSSLAMLQIVSLKCRHRSRTFKSQYKPRPTAAPPPSHPQWKRSWCKSP